MKRVSGVELVTIPATEYAELIACRKHAAETAISSDQLFRASQGKIDRNPEVAVFIAQRLGLESVKTILRKCKRLYGAARTPSPAATYRYWEKLRKETSKGPQLDVDA